MSTAQQPEPTSSADAAAPRSEEDKSALAANGNGQQAERNEGQVGRASLQGSPARAGAEAVRERALEHRSQTERLAEVQYRRCGGKVPQGELLSEAHLGLLDAARRFDQTRGVLLGAFVTMIVQQRLRRAVQRWNQRQAHQVCFTDLDELDSAANKPVVDLADPCMPEADGPAAVREALERVRRVLPERSYAVLRLHYVEGHALEEIGREMGVSRQRVRQIIKQAKERARRLCPGECGFW
jgi:RNA polymerase sigma factor (sigma-70 family)